MTERIGPLGLTEEDTRWMAERNRNVGSGYQHRTFNAMWDACDAAVKEWDTPIEEQIS